MINLLNVPILSYGVSSLISKGAKAGKTPVYLLAYPTMTLQYYDAFSYLFFLIFDDFTYLQKFRSGLE